MRILITNDDGIHAPGLAVLEKIARQLSDDVWTIAPETDQSGVAHSLSLSEPLRLREVGPQHYAVKGTPTDCVIMGVRHVMAERRPDLVLSGINQGQNVAEDVTYSGTIAAAMEGTLLGVRSIAMSQAYDPRNRANVDWSCAATHGAAVVRRLLEEGIPEGILMNVNFPACPAAEVTGLAVTVQGRRNQDLLRIDPRHDGRGKPYYWVAFDRGPFEPANGTDLQAMQQKRISITPLELDLTHEPTLTRLAQAFADRALAG